MNKVIKRLISATLAGAMAISMAATANADTVCRHSNLTKSRANQVNTFSTSHTIEVVVNGMLTTANCPYRGTVYACSYVCKSCHKIISSAGYEQVEFHQNTKCPRYSSSGVIV